MYQTDHSNTGPVHKKTRWRPFIQYSNGSDVWYSNGIRKPDYLASNLFSTIKTADYRLVWYSDTHCTCLVLILRWFRYSNPTILWVSWCGSAIRIPQYFGSVDVEQLTSCRVFPELLVCHDVSWRLELRGECTQPCNRRQWDWASPPCGRGPRAMVSPPHWSPRNSPTSI